MATIYPFRAIHPNPFCADQLVFTKPQAQSVAGENLLPLKTLLETGARQRPETREGQALAYHDIQATLGQLLESGQLFTDEAPAIYVYEISHPGFSQTGIWALTDLSDAIKTHERTFDDSVRRMRNYRKHTGLEGNPILLTYTPSGAIDAVIALTKHTPVYSSYESRADTHRLWKITDSVLLRSLVIAFASIKIVYLADGHHRLGAAMGLKNTYPSISSLYMSLEELKIRPYNRVVIPVEPIAKANLFKALLANFYLQETYHNLPVQPGRERHMGLYIEGEWFQMVAKPHTYIDRGTLDVSILQDLVLAAVFDITDPATDSRLKHAGGEKTASEMAVLFDEYPQAIGFTLCPMTTAQLIKTAEAGTNLPPKSSWIDPKVPYGLLLHRHED